MKGASAKQGLLIDSDVIIHAERERKALDLSSYSQWNRVFLSSIVASELLAGVYLASDARIAKQRSLFVESILAAITVLPFDLDAARVHARLGAGVGKNFTVGAHDLLIAATAVRYGLGVLTRNVKDFSKIPEVEVVAYK